MGTSDLSTFRFLKISKPNISVVQKVMALKYIERYIHEEHPQKSPVKKYFVF
jgi:hypothetical protein